MLSLSVLHIVYQGLNKATENKTVLIILKMTLNFNYCLLLRGHSFKRVVSYLTGSI